MRYKSKRGEVRGVVSLVNLKSVYVLLLLGHSSEFASAPHGKTCDFLFKYLQILVLNVIDDAVL